MAAAVEANPTSKARLQAVCTRESVAWLNLLLVTSLASLLDDQAFWIAIGLCLGMDVNTPHLCMCSAWADAKGYHALACNEALNRHAKHTSLNSAVKRALAVAEVFSQLEPSELILNDGRRLMK